MSSNYEVGTRAWQPDPTEGWIPSEVKEKRVEGDKVILEFLCENGEVCVVQCQVLRGLPSTDRPLPHP